MERRDFLSLLAAAPIAALAPLPKVLEQPRLLFHRNAFAMAMAPLYPVNIIYGRGYVRTMNPDGTIDVHRVGN